MNEARFRMLAYQARAVPIYHNPAFPPSLYYRFFRLLAGYHKPRLSVELGLCGGGGSLHLALGWSWGQVVGVDMSNEYPDNVKYLNEHYPNFRFWRGDSVASAPEIYREYGEVDILFVDTTHTYEQTMAEWGAWQPYLSRRAVVCLDDLHRPGMAGAWAQMPDPKLRLDFLHDGDPGIGGGFGVIWRS